MRDIAEALGFECAVLNPTQSDWLLVDRLDTLLQVGHLVGVG